MVIKPQIYDITDNFNKSLRIVNYAPKHLSLQIIKVLERMFLVNCTNIRMAFSMEATFTGFTRHPVYSGSVLIRLGETDCHMIYGTTDSNLVALATHCIGHQISVLINLENNPEALQEMIRQIMQEGASIAEETSADEPQNIESDESPQAEMKKFPGKYGALPQYFDADQILKDSIEEERRKRKNQGQKPK